MTTVGRLLTPAQIDAIRAVMRLFVEDDLASGVAPDRLLVCYRCQEQRPAIGAVRYDRVTLCNECSIDYEIARARGAADSVPEFVERTISRAASA